MEGFVARTTRCARPACRHPQRGTREGHFNSGFGPCRVKGCSCPAFVAPAA